MIYRGYFMLRVLLVLFVFGTCIPLYAVTKQGNYVDERIGDTANQTFEALLYYPDREWLFDFDTSAPFDGMAIDSGSVGLSTNFYMTQPQSLMWDTLPGASLTFDADVAFPKMDQNYYYLTVGIFQEDIPSGADKRAFCVELLSAADEVITARNIYMHRGGWNMLCSNLEFSSSQTVGKVRITQTGGAAGTVLLDNLMINSFRHNSPIFMSVGSVEVDLSEASIDQAENYPVSALTDEERDAFQAIANRVIPLPNKVSSISSSQMNTYRAFHAQYHVVTHGEYASGMNPLYYWRSVVSEVTDISLVYKQNESMCSMLKQMGAAWYQTRDAAQKEELGNMVVDLVRLATTFGGMPNAWYNGRGFADGVYYARELLEQEGLLDRATTLIMQQYGVDKVLFNEHRWDNPVAVASDGKGPEFFWQATADHLNTTSRSMVLSILTGADTSEKARNLYRLKSWMDQIALTYSPNNGGTLKPDGSWFHHWGNRFDNYGWVAGWRGATELVWWTSQMPFAVSRETKKRMNHMADVHFELMNKDGYVGSQDKMHPIPSVGFLNLARAGSPDGLSSMDPDMGSYWLAYPNDSTYAENAQTVSEMHGLGIEAAEKYDSNHTLSYQTSNIHRQGDWQAYTRGISTNFYHTQYERDGYLFYNIGGISLVKEGTATGMQRNYGSSLLQRHDEDLVNITLGYNFSRAPGVTSIDSDYSELRQIYYQRGTSPFVGGVSSSDGNGIFCQVFNAKDREYYADTVAGGLRFKKSYFYFGNEIVLLGSGISNDGDLAGVETGLLQEPVSSGVNEFSFADGLVTTGAVYDVKMTSAEVPWMYNDSLKMGVYLFPGQNVCLFKGTQTFGQLTGDVISTYLTHEGQTNGWYETILRLNTSETQMEQLNTTMRGSDPDYRVLRRDDKAHIVQSEIHQTTGYVVFDSTELTLPEGVLRSVDTPCVIMLKKQGGAVHLTVSSPDLHMEVSEENPLGWSQPVAVSMVLDGAYRFVDAGQTNRSATVNIAAGTTTITAAVKDGLSSEMDLYEIPLNEYVDWASGYGLNDEQEIGLDHDLDGDGYDNWAEFIAHTDPSNVTTFPEIKSITYRPEEGTVMLSWEGAEGRLYTIYYSQSMTGTFYKIAGDFLFPVTSYTTAVDTTHSSGFYQIGMTLDF